MRASSPISTLHSGSTAPGTQAPETTSSGNYQSDDWIRGLSRVLRLTDQKSRAALRTTVSCKMVQNHPSLLVPQDLARHQPDVLRYLHALANAGSLTLTEDRRQIDVQPIVERRSARPNDLALGVSLLLKQTGLPGPAHCLSSPHLLRPDNPRISIAKLIHMAAHVHTASKRVVFVPNRFLTGDFAERAEPMTGYACRVITREERLVVSYFNAPEFRALGYISNDQFVMHVILAGGPIRSPALWSPLTVLTDSHSRCQIYKGASAEHDFGLLYSTFYIDLDQSMEDQAWWLQLGDAQPPTIKTD